MSSALELMKTSDREEYEVIINFQCHPSLSCPKFVAIRKHMQDFFCWHSFCFIYYKKAKKTYEEEFWYHAPADLKEMKKNLLADPLNHLTVDKYSLLLKLYKYQTKYPLYKLPDDPTEKKSEVERIVNYVNSQNTFVLIPNKK